MRILTLILLIGAIPALAHTKTIMVPKDYSTLQAAIDAAENGDTVLAAPQTYVENINFAGKAITVKSSAGPQKTFIDGNQEGTVVSFESGEGNDAVLKGFTLTNGRGNSSAGFSRGGGLACRNSSSPTVIHNHITKNSAGLGGGIYCKDSSSPVIVNNNISLNAADFIGGGIYCHTSSPFIARNHIIKNTAEYSGAGIYCTSSSPSIINTIIRKNTSGFRGGAIYCVSGCEPSIVNTTIVQNTAELGGGIGCTESSPKVLNTILWKNNAPIGPEIWLGVPSSPSVLTIGYCNVLSGKASVHVETHSELRWGEGMIDADPLLIKDHLSWRSPCINMGTNHNAPLKDIDGDPRPHMGTADIGADEFIGAHSLECDEFTLSEAKGGVLKFKLRGKPKNAGRAYFIFGGASGTAPGTPMPDGKSVLPINWDQFTNVVANVNYPDSVIFMHFFGHLDSKGEAKAKFNTNGHIHGTLGYTVSFAFPLQGIPWDFVSNPINVEIIP